MSTLTGTLALLRFNLRRDRLVLPACVYAGAASVIASAASYKDLYPTAADRAKFAATIEGNAAFTVIYGPARAVDTLGGLVAWRSCASVATIVALMSLLLVGRHLRGDEERGRTELVRAGAVGRNAPVVSAVVEVAAANVAIAVLTAVGLIAIGLPTTGSIALAAAIASAGLVFAGVGAVTAQISESARAASGLAASLLGLAWVLRAVGDSGDGAVSWLSPIGWAENVRAYAGERWWPLLLAVAAAVLLTVLAHSLLARRDLGSGIVATRPGPPAASAPLTRPLGLALRLQRGSLIGWSAGLLVLGVMLGAIGQNVTDLLETSSTVEDLFTQAGGGDLVDAFFASMILFLALVASGYAVQSALRLRGEEASGRAEPLLATAIGRRRWEWSHLALSLAGTAVVLGAGGFGIGAAQAIGSGDAGELPRLLGAALAMTPAAWILAGIAAALFGLAPRASAGAWVALACCVLLWFLGPVLDLPSWVLDLSPFEHVPALPAAAFSAGPLLALSAVAAALVASATVGFARRDLS